MSYVFEDYLTASLTDDYSIEVTEETPPSGYVFEDIATINVTDSYSYLSVTGLSFDDSAIITISDSYKIPTGYNWLSGWQYRKLHKIKGSTAGEVTDYQIRIVVHYGSGTDNDEHVYLNGKCRSDFGDIRFTADDGVTELSYWIEEKVDGDYAIFWVKIPYIPAYPNTVSIYIYYGNPSATTTSNIKNTFVVGDDFDDGVLDPMWSIWQRLGAGVTVTETNGYVEIKLAGSNSAGGIYVALPQTMSKLIVEMKFMIPVRDTVEGIDVILQKIAETPPDEYNYVFWDWYDNNDTYRIVEGTKLVAGKAGTPPTTTFYKSRFTLKDTYARLEIPDANIDISATLSEVKSVNYIYIQASYVNPDTTIRVDDFRVRKLIEPEPTHYFWGVEETETSFVAYDFTFIDVTDSYAFKKFFEFTDIAISSISDSYSYKFVIAYVFDDSASITIHDIYTYTKITTHVFEDYLTTTLVEEVILTSQYAFDDLASIAISDSYTYKMTFGKVFSDSATLNIVDVYTYEFITGLAFSDLVGISIFDRYEYILALGYIFTDIIDILIDDKYEYSFIPLGISFTDNVITSITDSYLYEFTIISKVFTDVGLVSIKDSYRFERGLYLKVPRAKDYTDCNTFANDLIKTISQARSLILGQLDRLMTLRKAKYDEAINTLINALPTVEFKPVWIANQYIILPYVGVSKPEMPKINYSGNTLRYCYKVIENNVERTKCIDGIPVPQWTYNPRDIELGALYLSDLHIRGYIFREFSTDEGGDICNTRACYEFATERIYSTRYEKLTGAEYLMIVCPDTEYPTCSASIIYGNETGIAIYHLAFTEGVITEEIWKSKTGRFALQILTGTSKIYKKYVEPSDAKFPDEFMVNFLMFVPGKLIQTNNRPYVQPWSVEEYRNDVYYANMVLPFGTFIVATQTPNMRLLPIGFIEGMNAHDTYSIINNLRALVNVKPLAQVLEGWYRRTYYMSIPSPFIP